MNWRRFLRPIHLSFHSAAFYREVGRELEGNWFGYLFFLVALGAIPGLVRGHGAIAAFFGEELPAVIRQLPEIRVSGGIASIDPPGPHVVYDPTDNVPLIVLDTSGRTVSLDNGPASMLVLRDKVLLRREGREARVVPLAGFDNGVIDQPLLEGLNRTLWNWMSALYFPVGVLFAFLFRVLQLLVASVVGLLYARRVGAPLDYRGVLRLAVFAATPAVAASALRDALGLVSGIGSLIDFLLVLGYLHFAVRANAPAPSAG